VRRIAVLRENAFIIMVIFTVLTLDALAVLVLAK
jgi:hypothetical protein